MVEVFPYTPRKCQREIMQDITAALCEKKHFVFESGTGSGKTVCVLSSTLKYALEHQKRIVYTTRTNAQQRQVILELRAIRKKTNDERIFGVGMQGRANMCLLAEHDAEIINGTSEELSRFCSYQKKQTQSTKNKGCSFYRHFVNKKEQVETIVEWAKNNLPTAEEFAKHCDENEINNSYFSP